MHFIGFVGIAVIFALAFALSNNRKAINYRTVGVGLLIQVLLAIFILKTPMGKSVFSTLGVDAGTETGAGAESAEEEAFFAIVVFVYITM